MMTILWDAEREGNPITSPLRRPRKSNFADLLHGRARRVQHEVERRGLFRPDVLVNQKTLPVRRDVVSEQIGGRDRRPCANRKQIARRGGRKGSIRADGSLRQHLVRSDVKDRCAISAPAWLGAAATRYLPLAGRARKCG